MVVVVVVDVEVVVVDDVDVDVFSEYCHFMLLLLLRRAEHLECRGGS